MGLYSNFSPQFTWSTGHLTLNYSLNRSHLEASKNYIFSYLLRLALDDRKSLCGLFCTVLGDATANIGALSICKKHHLCEYEPRIDGPGEQWVIHNKVLDSDGETRKQNTKKKINIPYFLVQRALLQPEPPGDILSSSRRLRTSFQVS